MCSLGGRCLEIRARDARTWVICDSFELCLSADRRWKDGIGTSDVSQAGEQKNVVCGTNHSQHAHLMQRFQISSEVCRDRIAEWVAGYERECVQTHLVESSQVWYSQREQTFFVTLGNQLKVPISACVSRVMRHLGVT